MPWRKERVESQRGRFVIKSLEEGSNISELCREFGISRRTGYKWIERYEKHGIRALEDESRRPHNFPKQTRGEMVAEIVRFRTEHPTWGGKKIRGCLLRVGKFKKVPQARTIDRILKRCGLVVSKVKRKKSSLPKVVIVKPTKSNQVWTIDFKGWWLTRDGKRCEPLTIRDEHSRFIIGIFALGQTTTEAVKACLIECFIKYGVPQYFRCDNGQPFICTTSLCGLTRLSAWWLKLGITPNRIEVASPGMNGAHERMHLDMKKELQHNPAQNLRAEQKRFDHWRHEFNHLRPHEALKDDVPTEHYRSSKLKYKPKNSYLYPVDFTVRKVTANGEISWYGRFVGISKALAGEEIGVEIVDAKTARLWYTDYCLGVVDAQFKTPIQRCGVPVKKELFKKVA